jgi:RHS repeat-associated protein
MQLRLLLLVRVVAFILPICVWAHTAQAAACNPLLQSCAPDASASSGSSSGGQMCTPSAGGSTCGGSSVASQGNSSGTDQGAGNPINIINGNKYQVEVDMPALPGVLGLEIVRHYNSQYSLPNVPSGILGRGWKLSYETELHDTPLGLQIVQADGTRLIFQKNKADLSHCTSLNPANGVVTVLNKPQGKEFLWRWPGNGQHGGRSLLFNSQGKLVQIAVPTGEFVTLLYSPKGWLLQVRDPQGRRLDINYPDAKSAQSDKDDTHKFRGVQSIDSPVGRFAYQYGSPLPEGSELSTTYTIANLTQVNIPTWHDTAQRTHAFSNISPSRSSITRSYHYEDPKFPTLLTGISVQGSGSDGVSMHQRISSYGYDSRGKAVLSQKADGVEKVSLNTSTPKQTIITNSLGQTTTYRHADIAGQWRLLESRGSGCAQCGPANMRYGYDKLGRLTEQTTLSPQGQVLYTLRTTLDAQGRAQKKERIVYKGGKPSQPTGWVRYEYPTDLATEPSLIAKPSVLPGKEHRIQTYYNAAGQPVQVTESGYEPVNGQPIERTTRYTYQTINGNSVLATVDGPLPNGPLNSAQDSDITQVTWHNNGAFITAIMQPGGRIHEVANHPITGLLSEVKNPNGQVTQFVFDTQTRLVTTRSHGPGWSQPHTQSFRYNALGHATEMGTGEDSEAAQTFKPQARQGFDAAGRLLWHAGALGMLMQNRYDTENHLIQTGRYSSAMAQEVHAGYDQFGQVSQVQDNAGRAWSRTQRNPHKPRQVAHLGKAPARPIQLADDFGRVVLTASADHGSSSQSYDEADRLSAMTDAMGHTAHYQYTLQGRIARQTVTNAQTRETQTTHWRYNAQGQLIEVVHPTQTERYDYDARGLQTARLVTLQMAENASTPGVSKAQLNAVTRYSHDEQGRLVASTLPDGTQLRYLRNGQGQVTQVVRNTIRTPWLRWLGHEQTVVKDLSRDLVGLKSYTAGNGLQAHYQRSPQGDLARIAYVRIGPSALKKQAPLKALGRTTQDTIALLLGAMPAHAQKGALGQPLDPLALLDHRYLWDTRGNLLHIQSTGSAATLAMAHMADVPSQNLARQSSYAYDHQARLVASTTAVVAPAQTSTSRFAYDGVGRRVLSQQGIIDQTELKAGTQVHTYQPGTHRLINADARYTPNGQPLQRVDQQLTWDALGRMTSAQATRYTYDHRGMRNSKHVAKHVVNQTTTPTTYYLYDADRQPLAELNAHGRITRQYVYVANLPLAVTDTPGGQALLVADAGAVQQTWTALQDVGTGVQSWFSLEAGMGQLAWLHTNHLGAPEAATNAQGQLVWQARYEAFGAARVNEGTSSNTQNFALHLRLPGQYFDAETGLHYNRQRYYDPQTGQYLTPDPLGHPDGLNPYAYVRFNPMGYVDPDGLVLFAFDGTGNSGNTSDPAMAGSSVNNVAEFLNKYQDTGSKPEYVSGVGTVHKDEKYGDIDPAKHANGKLLDYLTGDTPLWINDMGGNYSGPARIDRMMVYMRDESQSFYKENQDTRAMDIDIVGFSRGAAAARDFANRITQASTTVNGKTYYKYVNQQNKVACQWVNFRFMGLWDTVLSTNFSGHSYQLGIPVQFAYVAQAVALNEYRSSNLLSFSDRAPRPYLQHWGGYQLESIGASSSQTGSTRIELGFIGAHADIGGGFADNELSKVALAWMIEQATTAGVKMDETLISISSTAVLHDKSNNIQTGQPVDTCALCTGGEDRTVNGAVSGNTGRKMGFGTSSNSMVYADTQDPKTNFIIYQDRNTLARYTNADVWDGNKKTGTEGVTSSMVGKLKTDETGTVNVQAYVAWLKLNGYSLNNLKVQ